MLVKVHLESILFEIAQHCLKPLQHLFLFTLNKATTYRGATEVLQ